MNGGSPILVTSAPWNAPSTMPHTAPINSASSEGTPWSAASLAITRWVSSIAVPTARSTPAVRTMSVWPMASVASTAVCCSMMPMVSGRWKRPLPKIVNTTHAASSTKAGLSTGYRCRACWIRSSGVLERCSAATPAAPAGTGSGEPMSCLPRCGSVLGSDDPTSSLPRTGCQLVSPSRSSGPRPPRCCRHHRRRCRSPGSRRC